MVRRFRFGFAAMALMLAVALLVTVNGGGGSSVSAQVSIDCAEFPMPAAAATADAATPEAEDATSESTVEFPADGGEITVFAAASLTAAFEQIAADIEASNPGVSVTLNFAGSQALVTQLTEGAEADVFASANLSQMNAALEAGLVVDDGDVFAQNQLVIIVPADNPAGITTAADLDNDGVEFVTALQDVPIGQYTRQSVCAMGEDTDNFGDAFVDGFAGNIVSEEENVTAIVTKISLGEADAGIVYETDVTADVADSVIVIPIEPQFNIYAEYPIALVEGGSAELGAAFVGYVLGPDGQATLEDFGFLPSPE
ncbi:MAG: molybdate ABC transporter substrate-binding protein [Thermomicrobiales bacterium]|nr:molybdate ABC transporter substrate-binding protein [Thermomicrobiales bacterium]